MNKTVRVVKTWRVVRVTYKERFTPLFGGKDWTSCFVFFYGHVFPSLTGRTINNFLNWSIVTTEDHFFLFFCFFCFFLVLFWRTAAVIRPSLCFKKTWWIFFIQEWRNVFRTLDTFLFLFLYFFQSDVKSSFFLTWQIFIKFFVFCFFPDFCVFCTQWVVRWGGGGGEGIVFWSFCSEMLLLTPVVF